MKQLILFKNSTEDKYDIINRYKENDEEYCCDSGRNSLSKILAILIPSLQLLLIPLVILSFTVFPPLLFIVIIGFFLFFSYGIILDIVGLTFALISLSKHPGSSTVPVFLNAFSMLVKGVVFIGFGDLNNFLQAFLA